jgi:hypothetical protein
MTTKTDTEKYFDQAADTFLNAFKSCVNLQEETAKKCSDLAKGWSDGEEWKKRAEDLGEQAMPNMQKAGEDTMKFWEKNAAKCMDLLGEGFAATQAASPSEAQVKLQKLWEESLGAMRENTETMVKLSSEAMQAYAEFMKDQAEKMPAAAATPSGE